MKKDQKDTNINDTEGVGSVIIDHSSDLHKPEGERLHQQPKGSPGGKEVNLQKRKTAVGTIFVPQSDLETHPHPTNDGKDPLMVKIRRRITEEPPPADDDLPDLWWT